MKWKFLPEKNVDDHNYDFDQNNIIKPNKIFVEVENNLVRIE